jgi:hypothetical protein
VICLRSIVNVRTTLEADLARGAFP